MRVTTEGQAIAELVEAHIATLSLQQDDVLVFYAPEKWNISQLREFADYMRDKFEVMLPHKNQILFLPGGSELAILRPAKV